MIPQGKLFLFIFFGRIRDTERTFSKLTDLYNTSISAREHIERAGKGT